MSKLSALAVTAICILSLAGCTSLSRHEQNQLRHLEAHGITIDTPAGQFEAPAQPAAAAILNILPGFGNFYLGSGRAAQSEHILYGVLNLLSWPLSIIWGMPEAAIDATNINKREMLYYHTYDKQGKKELKERGISLE